VQILLALMAYLVGSIPVGVLVGRAYGFDPRQVGSGNVGMTNVARVGGAGPAVLTFVGDVLKGLIPVCLSRLLAADAFTLVLVGLFAFLGSISSVFLGFRGGKGVATALGVWLGIAPVPILIALAIFSAVLLLSRVVSLASLAAALALPAATAALSWPRDYVGLAGLISGVVIYRHRANIQRLLHGQEPRIGTSVRSVADADNQCKA
jgi:glycerol-3-phosphate acyltransferase PlsY